MKRVFSFRRFFRVEVVASVMGILLGGCDPSEAQTTPDVGQVEQGMTVAYGQVSEAGDVSSAAPVYRHQIQLQHGGRCTFKTNLTSGSNPLADSLLAVFDASNNKLAENDDYVPSSTYSRVDLTLPAGTYYAAVWSYKSSAGGSYALEVSCAPFVKFHHNFYGDGDLWQCFRWAYGTMEAGLGEWTPAIYIDADNRVGGCYQQFGITDPSNLFPGLTISVNFYSDGDPDQCNYQGTRTIPVSNSESVQAWSIPYRINTDSRAGGCWQEFSLSGRTDVALDIEFLATDNDDQCNNTGTYLVSAGNTARFRINTDGRAGGCTQRFRLRKL